jgi:hypothetical protein
VTNGGPNPKRYLIAAMPLAFPPTHLRKVNRGNTDSSLLGIVITYALGPVSKGGY